MGCNIIKQQAERLLQGAKSREYICLKEMDMKRTERLLLGAKSRVYIRLKERDMKRNGSRVGKRNLTGFADYCRRAGWRFLTYTTGSLIINHLEI